MMIERELRAEVWARKKITSSSSNKTTMLSTTRAPVINLPRPPNSSNKTKFTCMESSSPAKPLNCTFSSSASRSSSIRENDDNGFKGPVSLQEWQQWGTASPLPSMVSQIVDDLKDLELNADSELTFGGLGGKLKGDIKVQEDKKHRAKYQALADAEEKIQFFSARQIACRLLGSRGYLCQKCWLPQEDCMCSKITHCSLWHGIRFWLYMHPKDFLRQNNTGKLLWQVFGVQAAKLCIFGVAEQEEIMWNAFKLSGKNRVWCLYPNKNAPIKSVQDSFTQNPIPYGQESSAGLECSSKTTSEDETLNFVLLDGTWNNSAAMFRRLKERAELEWGDDISCISLTTGLSSMHKLRPQPSWDRTCTAAAAIGLLSELQSLPKFSSHELDKQGEAIEDALEVLLEALTARRIRMGRSIQRRERR